MVMLLLIVYIAGVYLTQQVATYGHGNPEGVAEGTALHRYFGGILVSIMSLFQAISGGIDWKDLTDPLMEHISPFMGLIFALFVSFTMFSMLNVVTGIFVESALKNTKEETDIDMVNHLYKVFGDACEPIAGMDCRITLEEFEGQLENPRLQAYFRSIDLDLSEARGLFELLDIDETGSIDVEDFVMGCLRLRGPAKSINLADEEISFITDQGNPTPQVSTDPLMGQAPSMTSQLPNVQHKTFFPRRNSMGHATDLSSPRLPF